MKCPVCNLDLVMAERQGVEIDYCPKCRGVWLDRGELDKIIERSSAEVPQQRFASEHHEKKHHGHGHDGGHYNKGRGFLADLFD